MFLACAFAIVLLVLLISEARRAQWTLFEALVATAFIGHALVLPVALGIKAALDNEKLLAVGILALTCAAGMAFGAVWTFRNLAVVNEKRAAQRLLYLVLGLLLIPSIFAIPFNLLVGWFIWLPLLSLNAAAETVLKDAEYRLRCAELNATFQREPATVDQEATR